MLRFDLSEIARTPGMRQVYEISEPPYVDDDVEYVSSIVGRVSVTNTGSLVLVRGPLSTSILMECSRCLEPVRMPLSINLEEEFDLKQVEDGFHHDRTIEIVEDETEKVFEGKVLCLDVLIRQAALLEAPIQPLCRPDCPGIAVAGRQEETVNDSPFRNLAQYFDDK